jgi:NAD(P)-dependent dehydrogenase (short-subunit alcohol dehydrogenase family)
MNAAFSNLEFSTNTTTGHEQMFQVNYLSTALLSILLLPILKNKSPPQTPGRLTLVSSTLGQRAKFPNPRYSLVPERTMLILYPRLWF